MVRGLLSDQCLRIILTILLCPYMISTGITQQAYVKFNGYCPLDILYMYEGKSQITGIL